MKKLLIITISAIIAFASCGGEKTDNSDTAIADSVATERTDIRIAYTPTIDALPFFVAAERGYFAEDSVKLTLVPFAAHMDIDTALVGGSVDGAFTDIIRLRRMEKNDSLKVNYITSTELAWAMITNRQARLNRLEQFGDKMVATTRFSATDYLTTVAFRNVKTKGDVYRVQINDLNVRLNMMLNNELDAAWMPYPHAIMAQKKGHRLIDVEAIGKERLGVLALRHQLQGGNDGTEIAEKLAKVYSRAADSINAHGIAAYEAELRKYCNADTAVINRLPKIEFQPAKAPSEEILKQVEEYLN